MFQQPTHKVKASRNQSRSSGHRRTLTLRMERLENRCVPATITVTDVGDAVAVDGKVTLREAVQSVNMAANVNADVAAVGNYAQNDEIQFQIAGAGVKSIQLGKTLGLERTVSIKGYSQPGSAPNTNGFGLPINASPLIELAGPGGPNNFTGISVQAPNSKLDGLVVNRFAVGIDVTTAGKGSSVLGCFVGTNVAGNGKQGNDHGIVIQADNTQIGGTQPANRNLISGNSTAGIFNIVFGDSKGGNKILGNYIGTDNAGAAKIENKVGIEWHLIHP